MAHLQPEEMHQLIDQAAPYYLAAGFHVGEHRLEVLDAAQVLSALALSQGIQVDGQVVVLAANWHDAGMALSPNDVYIHEDNGVRPAHSSEEIAAELFDRAGQRVGAPKRLIHAVKGAIVSTNPMVPPKSTEAKILAAADVHGVGFDPYDEFVSNTRALWDEAKWRQARDIDWPDFVRGSMQYLGLFIARDIRLTQRYFDEQRRSAWHLGAVENILGLSREVWDDDTTTQGTWIDARRLDLRFGDDTESVAISMPVNNNVLSIPSDMLDVLSVSDRLARTPGVAKEVGRVLSDSGTLAVR